MSDRTGRRPAGGDGAPKSTAGQLDLLQYMDAPDTEHAAAARRAARDGMAAAEASAHIGWRENAKRHLADLAASGDPFTADDLYARIGPPLASSPQAIGAIFSQAARKGLIQTIGVTTSTRESRHGGLTRVWRGVGDG